MYKIGMQMKDSFHTYIRYIRVSSNQKTIYEILDKYYRCPKDVLKMICHGDVGQLKREIHNNTMNSWHEAYLFGDEFLTSFNSEDHVVFLFKNGTWFVNFLDERKPKLLSKLMVNSNV